MSNIKHDEAGFLLGEHPLEEAEAQEASVLAKVADDVHAIRKWFEQRRTEADSTGKTATVATAEPKPATAVIAMPNVHKMAAGVSASARAIPAAQPAPVLAKVSSAQLRDAMGRFVGQKVVTPLVMPKTAAQSVDRGVDGRFAGASSVADGAMRERDAKGRFTGYANEDREDGRATKVLGEIKDGIQGLVNVGGDAGEVDPSVKAAQEVAGLAGAAVNGVKAVGSIVAPIGRGMAGLLPGRANDAPTPWFRRFFGELRGLRREQSAFNKAELRVLKDIEGKPTDGKRGGFAMLGTVLMALLGPILGALATGLGMLAKIPGLGALGKLASAMTPRVPITQPTAGKTTGAPAAGGVSAAGGAAKPGQPVPAAPGSAIPEAAAGAGKKPGLLSRAGKGVGGALKRIPLLGAALAAVGIGAGVYDSESDDSLTRAEKDKKTGGVVGGGAGSIGGMLAGGAAGAKAGALLGAFGGPVGVAIGAGLGSVVGGVAGGFFGEKAGGIVGEKVGGWVTDLRSADIAGKIQSGWDRFTKALGEGFDTVLKKLGLEKAAENAKQVYNAAAEKAAEATLAAKRGYGDATGKFIPLNDAEANVARRQAAQVDPRRLDGPQLQEKGTINTLAEGAGRALGRGTEAVRDTAVGRGATAVADGLKRVFTREDGSQEVREGGTRAWRNHNPGNIRAGEFAKANGAIGQDADGFAIFSSAEAGAAAKQKLIFEGKNYKDLSLSAAIARYAPPNENDTGKYQRTILAAVGGQDKKMSDYSPAERAAITEAMTKMEGFKAGKSTVTPATVAPPVLVASTAAPVVATATPRVTTPPMPSLPAVSDPPSVAAETDRASASGDKKPAVVVVNNKRLVERDLANRTLAHIVTGGLAS